VLFFSYGCAASRGNDFTWGTNGADCIFTFGGDRIILGWVQVVSELPASTVYLYDVSDPALSKSCGAVTTRERETGPRFVARGGRPPITTGEQLLTEGNSAGVFSATGWSIQVDTDALWSAFIESTRSSATLRSDSESPSPSPNLSRTLALGALILAALLLNRRRRRYG